ncbi:MAG: hypothetical protein AAGA48_16870 [Myxococcota bacterium]
MRTSTTVMGLMGGVGLALALVAPLYVGLPSNYLTNWMYMTPGGGLAGVFLAGLVLMGTGFLSGALSPTEPVRSGTYAAGLSAFLGAAWMLSPGMAVEALRELLRLDALGELSEAIATSLAQVLWYPPTAALGLLAAGPALGALGGIAFDLWYAAPNRPVRVVRPSPVPFVGLLAAAIWGGALAYFQVSVNAQLEPLGGAIDTIKQSAAPAILGLWTTIFLCWALRDAILYFRGDKRMRGAAWAMGAIALALLTLTPLAYHDALLESPVLWGGIAVALLASTVTMFLAARTDAVLDPERRTVTDLLVESVLIGVFVVGLGILTIGPLVFAELLIINPRIAELSGETPSGVDGATAVQWLFRYHWLSALPMAGVAFGWAIVRLPTLWMRRAFDG